VTILEDLIRLAMGWPLEPTKRDRAEMRWERLKANVRRMEEEEKRAKQRQSVEG